MDNNKSSLSTALTGCLIGIGMFVLIPFVWYTNMLLGGYVLSHIWNWFMPTLFGVGEITPYKATALGFVGTLFVGSLATSFVFVEMKLNQVKKDLAELKYGTTLEESEEMQEKSLADGVAEFVVRILMSYAFWLMLWGMAYLTNIVFFLHK